MINEPRNMPIAVPVCYQYDTEELVARIMQIVEIAIPEDEHAKRTKDLIKLNIYEWYNKLKGYTDLIKYDGDDQYISITGAVIDKDNPFTKGPKPETN